MQMDIRKQIRNVTTFYDDNRPRLLKLLVTITNTAEDLKAELGKDYIQRIYSRSDKQRAFGRGNDEFKSATKVAKLIICEDAKIPSDVDDLLGLTIVVHYSDQIKVVEDLLIERLTACMIKQDKSSMKASGYFAKHIVWLSEHPDHSGLKCEVQIKTMLHDAWAWKTHDLTYKPRGQLDSRLATMMSVFSDGLEAMERQSQMLRDVIVDRWRVEESWRSSVRRGLLAVLPVMTDWKSHSDKAKELRAFIEAEQKVLVQATSDSSIVLKVLKDIIDLKKSSLFEAYLLYARFAILRDTDSDRENAISSAWAFYDAIEPAQCSDAKQNYQIWGIPLVLQACGDIESAISIGRELLDQSRYPFNERDTAILALNLANHLIEQAHLDYANKAKELAQSQEEILRLLTKCGLLSEHDPSALVDTRGMVDVVFSTTSLGVRQGMVLIEEGRKTPNDADPSEDELAQIFYFHNMGIAWQRLREVTADELRSTRGPL